MNTHKENSIDRKHLHGESDIYENKSRKELIRELEALRNRVDRHNEAEMRCKENLRDLQTLATVVKDSNDAITLQNFDGTIVSWNRAAEKIYGYSSSEMTGKNIADIIPKQIFKNNCEIVNKLRKGGIIQSYETQRITKDRKILDIWLTQTVIKDESGQPRFIATTERDITERKRQEKENERLIEELKRSNNQLKRVNQFKDKLIGMVAHDLRNPLYVISEFSKSLLEDGEKTTLNEQQSNYIKRIHKASDSMAKLIQDLLDYSKLEHGKIVLEMKRNDIREITKDRIEQYELNLSNKDIKLQTELDDVPEFVFDKNRIEQVIDNLISNAIKFSPRNSTIRVSLKNLDNSVEFSVQDEGPGISKDEQKLLFREFQTLSSKPTGGEDSAGLGLNIVKGLVSLHHGKVGVFSELGKGAKFYFQLPKILTA